MWCLLTCLLRSTPLLACWWQGCKVVTVQHAACRMQHPRQHAGKTDAGHVHCIQRHRTHRHRTRLHHTRLHRPPSLQGVYIAGVLQLRRPCSIAQTTQDAAGAAHCSLPAAAGVGASVRITSLCVQQTSRPAAGRLPPRQRQLRPSLPHRVAPHPHTYHGVVQLRAILPVPQRLLCANVACADALVPCAHREQTTHLVWCAETAHPSSPVPNPSLPLPSCLAVRWTVCACAGTSVTWACRT